MVNLIMISTKMLRKLHFHLNFFQTLLYLTLGMKILLFESPFWAFIAGKLMSYCHLFLFVCLVLTTVFLELVKIFTRIKIMTKFNAILQKRITFWYIHCLFEKTERTQKIQNVQNWIWSLENGKVVALC